MKVFHLPSGKNWLIQRSYRRRLTDGNEHGRASRRGTVDASKSPTLPLVHSSSSHHTPTNLESIKALLFGSYFNVLLVFVPLSFVSHFARWGSTADFLISFCAIVPLAGLLGEATEQVALKLGQTLGGLLNATFGASSSLYLHDESEVESMSNAGNAVEAIVGILALVKGELRIVQTSMLGSILSNLLLVLGCSFFAAGFYLPESNFQVTAAQASSSLMTLACITLIIPAAYHSSSLEKRLNEYLRLGTNKTEPVHTTALVLQSLGTLGDPGKDEIAIEDPVTRQGLLAISRGTAIILLIIYIVYLWFQLKTHAYLFEAQKKKDEDGEEIEEEEEEAKMNPVMSIVSLVVVTVLTSFCADYLVDSIDEFANSHGIPKAFIGIILIPIVGNAAEHLTSVWMAMKDKMEITIGVSVGSSIQIAVGVIPFLVLVGWVIGKDLTLYFENFETICLFISVILVNLLVQDGKSNYMEGVMLISLYVIIALAFWVS
ncbi:calcium/proton exchanger [Atractiella rhizophila]|nr:calcium/proton exchanger [Atractiella rhizophila]